MSYSTLKTMAKQSLKGNWLIAIGLFVVSLVVSGSVEWIIDFDEQQFSWSDALLMLASLAISLLLLPMTIGLTWAWIDLSRNKKVGFGQLIEPYRTMFVKSVLTGLLHGLLLFLWSLLFIVPGIIKSFSYLLTYYILRDDPELSPLQAITKSRQMMDGHKGKAFLLGLSFIGWFLLSIITLGIALLWVVPYVSVTFAHFYNTVRAQYEKETL